MRFSENLKEEFVLWLRQGILSGKVSDFLRGLTDILYYPVFAFCYGWIFIVDSTMFSKKMPDAFKETMTEYYHIAVFAALLCAVAAMLAQNSVHLAVFETLLMIVGYTSYKIGGHKFSYFVLCVLIVGATGRSFRKILSISFVLGCLGMAAAYAGCRLGIIEDLVYRGGRHAYGMVYCTDCAAHILFLMLTYAMLRIASFRIADYAVLVFGVIFMWGTGGKTNMICAGLLFAVILLHRLARHPSVRSFLRRRGMRAARRVLGAAVSFSFPACAAFSFGAVLLIPSDSPAIKPLGHTIAKRLELGLRALQEHPFTFFGTKIKEHSFGGRTTNLPGWDSYFFIDCSYIRYYLFGGAILFVMLLIVLTCTQIRCYAARKDVYLMILMIAAMVCIMEHHLVDFSFNVFPLMAFSDSRFFRGKPPQIQKPGGKEQEQPAQETC
ncbi:MAG: hypothetical protein Q4D81_01365 [Eubacteriales bacterium]|nr:hypothetical protein [Eubacteriales bacterium]